MSIGTGAFLYSLQISHTPSFGDFYSRGHQVKALTIVVSGLSNCTRVKIGNSNLPPGKNDGFAIGLA
ncbi:MAG: hypothetical protein CK545_04215, partial [Actinobacteria bacterium]